MTALHQAAVEREAARGGVAAVVVTYNRREVLRRTLQAVGSQSRRPDVVLVVDNASSDGTGDMLAADFPDAVHVVLDDNLGFAAGLAAGMERAVADGHTWCWLLDDDSRPAPASLARCLQVAAEVDGIGVLGLSGGALRRGVPDRRREALRRLSLRTTDQAYAADFVLVDGAVVHRDAVLDVGLPRGDFFMMLEDVEYTGRAKRAGWQVVLLDEPLIDRGHMGSGGAAPGGCAPPWRGYYHSRNQLLMALERRSPGELLGWCHRQGKLMAGAVLHRDRKWERVRLRLLGGWHALRGKTGRTIEPRARA